MALVVKNHADFCFKFCFCKTNWSLFLSFDFCLSFNMVTTPPAWSSCWQKDSTSNAAPCMYGLRSLPSMSSANNPAAMVEPNLQSTSANFATSCSDQSSTFFSLGSDPSPVSDGELGKASLASLLPVVASARAIATSPSLVWRESAYWRFSCSSERLACLSKSILANSLSLSRCSLWLCAGAAGVSVWEATASAAALFECSANSSAAFVNFSSTLTSTVSAERVSLCSSGAL
jgi:hypothetical protein